MKRELLKLYAVTDRSWLAPGESLGDAVRELLEAGATMVQLREKKMSDEELLKEAEELQKLCEAFQVPLIINDRPDIAMQVKAAGVHVGLSDMGIEKARAYLGKEFLIGGSAHNVEEALAAQAAGADYIGCGAVFGSRTKTDASTLGLDELRAICRAADIPVVAIGGISLENAGQLLDTGIAGVAVISALFAAEDKKAAAERFLELLDRAPMQNR